MPAYFHQPTGEGFSPDDAVEHLQARVDDWSAFCDDLTSCEKLRLTWYDTGLAKTVTVGVFLMEPLPIVVSEDINGVQDFHEIYYSVDWTFVEPIPINFVTDTKTTLRAWFVAQYGDANYHSKGITLNSGAFWLDKGSNYLYLPGNYTGASFQTIKQVFTTYRGTFQYGKASERWKASSSVAESGAWSAAAWPEIPGFNTQYIDNIGVFVPVGYSLDQNLTYMVINALRAEIAKPTHFAKATFNVGILDRIAVLTKAVAADNLQEFQQQQQIAQYGNVPFIGQFVNTGVSLWNYSNRAQRNMFWPRIYAFGRNTTTQIPTKKEMADLRDFYYKRVQQSYTGPAIVEAQYDKVETLIKALVEKGYINSNQAGGWLIR